MLGILFIVSGFVLVIVCSVLIYKNFKRSRQLKLERDLSQAAKALIIKTLGNVEIENIDVLTMKPGVVMTKDNAMLIAMQHALWDSPTHHKWFKSEKAKNRDFIENVTKGDKNGRK